MMRVVSLLGWILLLLGLAPVLMTAWTSFSPDSFLTLPVENWSLKWYERFFVESRWWHALLRSLLLALFTTLPTALLALLLTRSLTRLRWWILLPGVLPPVVLGFGLLPLFHRLGLWGTFFGVGFVHVLLGLPVAFLLLRARIGPRLRELEDAARGLGGSRWQVLLLVTIPILRPTLIAVLLTQFVLSWNESLVTVFLTSANSETLPVVMWSQLQGAASPLIAVAATVASTVGQVALLPIIRLLHRGRLERMGSK